MRSWDKPKVYLWFNKSVPRLQIVICYFEPLQDLWRLYFQVLGMMVISSKGLSPERQLDSYLYEVFKIRLIFCIFFCNSWFIKVHLDLSIRKFPFRSLRAIVKYIKDARKIYSCAPRHWTFLYFQNTAPSINVTCGS